MRCRNGPILTEDAPRDPRNGLPPSIRGTGDEVEVVLEDLLPTLDPEIDRSSVNISKEMAQVLEISVLEEAVLAVPSVLGEEVLRSNKRGFSQRIRLSFRGWFLEPEVRASSDGAKG